MVGTRVDGHGMKRGAASESSNIHSRQFRRNLGCELCGLRDAGRGREALGGSMM